MKKEIENGYNQMIDIQNLFINSQILKQLETLKRQLQSQRPNAAFILEFLEEASKSSVWNESSHLDKLRKGVQLILNDYSSRLKAEISLEIKNLEVKNQSDLPNVERTAREKINTAFTSCIELVRSLHGLVDGNDPNFSFDNCNQQLTEKIEALKVRFENAVLETQCTKAVADMENERKKAIKAGKNVEKLTKQNEELKTQEENNRKDYENRIDKMKEDYDLEINKAKEMVKEQTESNTKLQIEKMHADHEVEAIKQQSQFDAQLQIEKLKTEQAQKDLLNKDRQIEQMIKIQQESSKATEKMMNEMKEKNEELNRKIDNIPRGGCPIF